MRYGSLFTGVGGFDLGCDAAGWELAWQCEIDPVCQGVLEHHWPNVTRYTDVTTINGADIEPVDVITYGFPCQDVSAAGRQAGLDGHRSGLFYETMRIIREMREATDGRYPRWAVAENVDGLRTGRQGDGLLRVYQTLADSGAVVIEHRVVDAQFFGVPQRRRRVFVVAGFDPRAEYVGELLPLAEGRAGDHRARRAERAKAADSAAGRTVAHSVTTAVTAPASGGMRLDDAQVPQLVPVAPMPVASAFLARSGGGGSTDVADAQAGRLVALSPVGFDTKFSGQFDILDNAVSGPVRTDCSPPGVAYPAFTKARRAMSADDHETWEPNVLSPCMNTFDNGGEARATVVAFDGWRARRLTPVEVERLMGWPDHHTAVQANGKPVAQTRRYKMCGNGVVAPVGEWIARQLGAADERLHALTSDTMERTL